MYISINWIKDFVDLDGIDVDKLIYNFTMSTAEVEGSVKYGYDTNGVVVGKILEIEKIENSDKLSKVLVDIGNEKVQSLCGAKNIFIGAKVPFVKAGSTLQGEEVKSSKIDGNISDGICLSEKELGISADHSGVMILDDGLEVGEDIKKIIPLEDTIFEVDNKSITNRPDLWGHYGIAREIAAITKRKLKPLPVDDLMAYESLPSLDISIKNSEECYRYSGITVENITKNVSPYTMKVRLYYTGLRSINLLADITNYVMLEIGQPMHAFDANLVKSIRVESLEKDEDFVTLDGITRHLPAGTLMIKNDKKPVAIAGIMGGLETEIADETTSLFLESATFDSTLIRKTALKIAHRTDASARYEKTLDPEFVKLATSRFIYLLKENDKDIKVTSSFTDVYLKKYPVINIEIDKKFFDRYIGIDIPFETIVETLKNLKFGVKVNGEKLSVTVPSFRATKDVTAKADLIEEVARIYGYDNIMPQSNLWKISPVKDDEERVIEYETKKMLAEKYGMSEIHSYVWYSEEQNKELEIKVGDNLKIVNGLNRADSTLREYMAPTMLYYINSNLRFLNDCNIFEVGRTFKYNFDGKNYDEKKILAIGLASTKKDDASTLYMAKSIVESIFKINKNTNVEFIANDGKINYSWIHKINSYDIVSDKKSYGYVSLIHPRISEKINKKASIVVIEIDLDEFSNIEKIETKYHPISKYQVVNFDLSLLVKKDTMYSNIQKIIENTNIEYLQEYNLIDIYENDEKLKDKKSVTIRFKIGSYDKTLSKEEIDNTMNTLIAEFAKNDMNLEFNR